MLYGFRIESFDVFVSSQTSQWKMDTAALDKEYSPSLWSKRFSNGDQCITSHIDFVSRESSRVRNKFKYETVSYGSKANENFDVFGIDLPLEGDSPIVVYVHGGYWQQMTKEVSAYCVDPLVSNGFKVIVVEYDLCPAVTLNELIQQIKKCGEFVLKYAKSNKCGKLTFCGHSAGAHLILCMIDNLLRTSMQPIQIHSLFLISGIYDLTELQHTSINKENILSIDSSKVDELSPLTFDFRNWSNQQFNVKIYVAEHDSPTFIKQSLNLSKQLERNEVKVEFHFVDVCDHFDIVERLSDESFELTQDLLKNL